MYRNEPVKIKWHGTLESIQVRATVWRYGPKSCKYYKMGKARGVSYKNRGTHYDEGWLDDICTQNRDYDE